MYINLLQTPDCVSDEQRALELNQMEEQRIIILNNLEELEQKIKELTDQMDESSREVAWLFLSALQGNAQIYADSRKIGW